jgi:hypothetical protein
VTPTSKRRRVVDNKPRLEDGAFVRITLEDGTFAYGRYLSDPYFALYKLRTAEPISDLDVIEAAPVLFTTSTRIGRHWTPLGTRPLRGEVAKPVVRFHQEIGDYRKCTIYDSVGNSRPATPAECIGLERAAVWEPHHLEARLLDTFEGRPNRSAEHLKVRLAP